MAATKVHQTFTNKAWVDLQAFFDNSTQGNPTGIPAVAASILEGDAIRATSANIDMRVAVEPRADENTGLRTSNSQFAGRRDATFTVTCYMTASATAGVAPDWGALLKNALGTETIVGGTSVTYLLSGDASNELTEAVVLLLERDPDHSQYMVNGVIETVTITANNGEPLMIEFAGVGAVGAEIGFCRVTAAGPSTTVDATDATFLKNIRPWVGNKIEFYNETTKLTDDNSGSGYTLSAVPNSGTSFTIAPAVTTGAQSRVRAFNPARTIAADTVVSGPAGTQIDSAAFALLSMAITLSDLNQAKTEAGFWGVSRGYRKKPTMTASLDFLSDSEHDSVVMRALHGAPFDEVEFSLVADLFNGLFTTDGKRWRITMPKLVPVAAPVISDNEGEGRTVSMECSIWNSDGASTNDAISIANL